MRFEVRAVSNGVQTRALFTALTDHGPATVGDRTREPGFMLGGETRIGGGSKLMAEAWKLPGISEVPVVFGFRFFGRRLSTDFGFLYVLGTSSSGFPLIPWLDFAIHF